MPLIPGQELTQNWVEQVHRPRRSRDIAPPVHGSGRADEVPPWAVGPIPPLDRYQESEVFVAGALSTLPPFDRFHPQWALPFARQALDALSEWEPTDARGSDDG